MKWETKIIRHKGLKRIAVIFAYTEALEQEIRTFEDAHWSSSKRCWHVPFTQENLDLFGMEVPPPRVPNDEGILAVERFLAGCILNAIANTIKTYTDALIFLKSF
jgi:integrase/recombinase XerD